MAKIEKVSQVNQVIKQVRPWMENKIVAIRRVGKPLAARASRYGAPAGVALAIFILISSFFLPKDIFQQAKETLLRNPNDFRAQIILAEKFLENNQFEEAERVLLLAQKHLRGEVAPAVHLGGEVILGEKTNNKLNELWQKKHYSDPKDIRQLISAWEKIIEEKPGYRDGYLQLAYLYYKLYENEKAKEYLDKALELDPNYGPARELEKIIK